MSKRTWPLSAGAVMLSAAIALGSGGIATAAPPEAHAVTRHAANDATSEGKALFRAIYFGVGPQVAEVRAKLSDNSYASFVQTASTQTGQEQAADNVVSAIEAKNSKFFANFHSALTSGDVMRVDAKFKQVQKVMTETLASAPQQIDAVAKSDTANPLAAVPVFIWAAAVWDVAAAVNYAVGVNVAVAAAAVVVVYAKVAFWPSAVTAGSQLESENTISEFSAALAQD
ncbi:SdpC family antimicrobial peptide [Arthrobacter bambusae]|uniref:SdpC family antimicrobial peptide n=1 Tax=Arthrobacter bambusae TaxID=1338426 RepID=A0ABV2P7F4_9MICC